MSTTEREICGYMALRASMGKLVGVPGGVPIVNKNTGVTTETDRPAVSADEMIDWLRASHGRCAGSWQIVELVCVADIEFEIVEHKS